MPKGWGICQPWHFLFLLAVTLPVFAFKHPKEISLRSAVSKCSGRRKKWHLLQNLCLTKFSIAGCVISLVWEMRSKPRLLGNGVLWGDKGRIEELDLIILSLTCCHTDTCQYYSFYIFSSTLCNCDVSSHVQI